MPTVTDLCNNALGQIGQSAITAIDDGTPVANICLRFFETVLKARLRSHRWNFATARAELAIVAPAPPFGYTYNHALPSDFIAMQEFNGEEDPVNFPYKIEGRLLLSNDATVQIVYTRYEDDPNIWDPLFFEGFELMMASRLAAAITHNMQLSGEKFIEGRDILSRGETIDGQEGSLVPWECTTLTTDVR